jgi:hypothetical protein
LQGFVLQRLVVVHQRLHWHPGKQRVPLGQDQRLPQPPDAALARAKRVDVFQPVVNGRTVDERVRLAVLPTLQQLLNKARHLRRQGTTAQQAAIAAHHRHAARAKLARLTQEGFGQLTEKR